MLLITGTTGEPGSGRCMDDITAGSAALFHRADVALRHPDRLPVDTCIPPRQLWWQPPPLRIRVPDHLLVDYGLTGPHGLQSPVGPTVLLTMRQVLNVLASLLMGLIVPATSLAAERTVVLSIPTMDCETCPITIRIALLKVNGVSRARVSYRQREAQVTFDDTRTGIDALRAATRDAGYPALEK
jgi:periplasmic mercuric ion binding protein